jgi:hypothetical protein
MAIMEQLVFGSRQDGGSGRAVLGTSPGLVASCVEEVVRLCESWGAVPEGGLRQPALLSFPLVNALPDLPGNLYTVIRIAPGFKPIFHALVLNQRDFQKFDFNPFTLAQEDVFLSSWQTGHELQRLDMSPGSLAPLVSPPPSQTDLGFVDEALRQMLGNQRLLLPLERASRDSDRFLALVIASLPRAMRLDLRFASWAPSGTNRYSLAATFKESALFTAWNPFLQTCVLGQLDSSCEEYLDDVRTSLKDGDLAGLERLSSTSRVDFSGSPTGGSRPRPLNFTASVDERSAARMKTKAERKLAQTPGLRPGLSGKRPRPQVRNPQKLQGKTPAASQRRRSRPVARRRHGRTRRGFSVLLALAIIVAGAYYLWTSGHWTRLPGLATGDVRLQTDPRHGVVDVAALYRVAMRGVGEAGVAGLQSHDGSQRRRGLEMLHQAGQLLTVQGHDYLEQSDQTLDGIELNGVAPAPADAMHARGRVLARELRRLALAGVSLGEAVDWHDLSDLDDRAVQARFDSLLAQRHRFGTLEPALAEVDRLLQGVDVSVRQVGGLAQLEALLAADRWDPTWISRCESAIDDLGSVRQAAARRLRRDAVALVRLKRAEHATDLGSQAFIERYTADHWAPAAVLDVLPSLQARLRDRPPKEVAPLLQATAAFYADLASALAPEVSEEALGTLIGRLAANRVVGFDPAMYADHVARLSFQLLERSAEAGLAVEDLPSQLRDRIDVREALTFLAASRAAAPAATWQQLGATLSDPFLVRWSNHRARALTADLERRRADFAVDLERLRQQRDLLLQMAAAGGNCSPLWQVLNREADRVCNRYRGAFPPGSAEADHWQRVAALADVLAQPPALSLTGVTVRLDQELASAPRQVVVELVAGTEEPLRTEPLRLGPAAPAGSGWVGSSQLDWTRDLAPGTPLAVRILDAADGHELARLVCTGWLEDWTPRKLSGLSSERGVRVSWHLASSFWGRLELPELES